MSLNTKFYTDNVSLVLGLPKKVVMEQLLPNLYFFPYQSLIVMLIDNSSRQSIAADTSTSLSIQNS
jgi:hypothetical protein